MADLSVVWPAFDEDDEDFAEWNDPPAGAFPGPGPVTFPSTDLALRVYIALGADLTASWLTWPWLDITSYVRFADGISTQTGRQDESGQMSPGSTRLRLDNRDSIFSRRNPLGPYYGLLSKNTPLWIQVDAGSGFKTRVQHFVNEWPKRWDKSGNDSTIPIAASGILRRLQQGRVVRSPLRRTTAAQDPVAYWPLEDPTGSTSAASVIAGAAPLAPGGTVEFGTVNSLPGATASPDTTLGMLSGPVAGVSATGWWVQFGFLPPNALGAVARIYTNGALTNVVRFFAPAVAGDLFSVVIDDDLAAGPSIGLATTAATGWADAWHSCGLSLIQSGSNIVTRLYIDGTLVATDTTAGTLGSPYSVLLNQNYTSSACPSFGHVGFGDGAIQTGYYDAVTANVGEQAHARVERVCREEGIPFTATSSRSTPMGPQAVAAAALDIFRDCEGADLGSLYEVDFGLGYQAPSVRYNTAPLLTLDFGLGQVAEAPEPADDDQRTRNRWTASRPGGTEATVSDSASIADDGLYDDSSSVNVEADSQLGNVAGWQVHLGTVDEDRWPLLEINLAGSPELIDDWCALPFGGRLAAVNAPEESDTDDIDAVLEGYAERFDTKTWRAGLNTSPYRPYEVQIVGETNGNLGRIDSANSTLTAAVLAATTSLSVASPGAVWVTGAVSFDLEIGGEQVTVTNIAGATSPQTFTVTRAVNGVSKDQAANTKVRLWRPGVIAL